MNLFDDVPVDDELLADFRTWAKPSLTKAAETLRLSEEQLSAGLAVIRKKLVAVELALSEKEGKQGPKLEVMLYTDGSCRGGVMGIGIKAISSTGHCREVSENAGEGNAQIAELLAVRKGLETIPAKIRARTSVVVYTDSAYAIGVLTGAFKTKKNRELVEDIRGLVSGFASVRYEKVRAHSGHFGNVKADKLARAASRQ
jgi:ribonuclease HI